MTISCNTWRTAAARPAGASVLRARSSIEPFLRGRDRVTCIKGNGVTGIRTFVCTATPAVRGSQDAAADPFATMEEYHDNIFDRFMIRYFSQRMSANLGGLPFKEGFQGFVELSKEMMRGRNSQQQQQTVAGVLESLLPPNAPASFRKLFPMSQWTAEINAMITKTMFAWLVGPMEVQKIEVQHEGKTHVWSSGVHIKKCRYMEQTACAGICTNLCKLPTQDFFTNTFGLPLTMNPNFEDLSCEMKFGVAPPPVEQDAVYGQPCYKICEIAQEGRSRACHRLDTERAKKGLSDQAVPASALSNPNSKDAKRI